MPRIDDFVTEDFLKRYVAFKAETTFVNVVPQANRLRILINLDFPEVDDPRAVCEDVTERKTWRNGSVRFRPEKMDDVPYAIGLARQALEKQLGEKD